MRKRGIMGGGLLHQEHLASALEGSICSTWCLMADCAELQFEQPCCCPAGPVSKIRLLGDYHHATRIAFIEFDKAECAKVALNCSGALLGALAACSIACSSLLLVALHVCLCLAQLQLCLVVAVSRACLPAPS